MYRRFAPPPEQLAPRTPALPKTVEQAELVGGLNTTTTTRTITLTTITITLTPR